MMTTFEVTIVETTRANGSATSMIVSLLAAVTSINSACTREGPYTVL